MRRIDQDIAYREKEDKDEKIKKLSDELEIARRRINTLEQCLSDVRAEVEHPLLDGKGSSIVMDTLSYATNLINTEMETLIDNDLRVEYDEALEKLDIAMEIKKIVVAWMNNGAHFQFMSNALAKAKTNTVVADKASSQVAVLEDRIKAEDEALKIPQKSLLTDDIEAADCKCDELYMAYRKLVKGSLDAPIEAMAEAAKVLNQSIKDYGIDPQMQLDKDTGLLANLLTDHQDNKGGRSVEGRSRRDR